MSLSPSTRVWAWGVWGERILGRDIYININTSNKTNHEFCNLASIRIEHIVHLVAEGIKKRASIIYYPYFFYGIEAHRWILILDIVESVCSESKNIWPLCLSIYFRPACWLNRFMGVISECSHSRRQYNRRDQATRLRSVHFPDTDKMDTNAFDMWSTPANFHIRYVRLICQSVENFNLPPAPSHVSINSYAYVQTFPGVTFILRWKAAVVQMCCFRFQHPEMITYLLSNTILRADKIEVRNINL